MKYEDVSAILYRNHGVFDITTPFGTQRRRLFLSTESKVCEFAKRSRRRGYPIQPNEIKCWLSISKVTKPTTNIVAKFQRYASRATFPSAFVRKCLEADPTKDCYENRLTTGTRIDGEIISLDAISRNITIGRWDSSERLSKNGATLIPDNSLSVVMTVPYGLRSSKRTITTIKPEILPQASVKSIVAVPTDITMP